MSKSIQHTKSTYWLSFSTVLERAFFYGIRALLVLYLTSESFKMETSEAIKLYGWFTVTILVTRIIGGLIGDFIIGHKRTIIIGGILQAIGAFALCLPNANGIYIGGGLIALGSGLYSPNLIAKFGKLYLNKTKLLYTGFTILHLAKNIGSFIGVLLLSYISRAYSYQTSFIIAGLIMIGSLVPILQSKESDQKLQFNKTNNFSNTVIHVLIVMILVGIFWEFSSTTKVDTNNLYPKFTEGASSLYKYSWDSIEGILLIPIGLIVIALWSRANSNLYYKLMLGFLFAAVSFGILIVMPDASIISRIASYIICILLFTLAELHIGPVLNAFITKYTNPKYLATVISISSLPIKIILFVLTFSNDQVYSYLDTETMTIVMFMISVGLGIYIFNRKTLLEKD